MPKTNFNSRHQAALWAQEDPFSVPCNGDPLVLRRDGLITPRQAAELCGVTVDAVHAWTSREVLPVARREGGRLLLNLLDVLRVDNMTRVKAARRPVAIPAWRIEGEPEVDFADVLRACQERVQAESGLRTRIVYYIRFGDRIKIGTTTCLRGRLGDLPYDEVLATEPGGREVEKHRHRQFAALSIGREWFRAEPVLLEHISAVARGACCSGRQ